MSRKITVTIELSEDMARLLDQWEPLPYHCRKKLPAPSRDDKVSMAVLQAVLLGELVEQQRQDFADQIDRGFSRKPLSLREHEERKHSRAREDGQN